MNEVQKFTFSRKRDESNNDVTVSSFNFLTFTDLDSHHLTAIVVGKDEFGDVISVPRHLTVVPSHFNPQRMFFVVTPCIVILVAKIFAV